MWTTLAVLAALSVAPGQSDALTFSNVRATYGLLGAERSDSRILPGDGYFIAFDVDGVKVDENGRIRYNMAMEVLNSQGKIIYGRDPQDLEQYNALGGNRLQVYSYFQADFTQPPGEYSMKVTVTDRASKAKATLTQKFEVLAKGFGLVRLTTSYDPNGQIHAPPVGITGQSIFVNFVAVGFDRDSVKKQPNVEVEMRMLDESGKPTLAKPFTGGVNEDVGDKIVALPMNFYLAFNRPGKFTVELIGTDKVTKKQSKVSFPLVVWDPKQVSALRTN